MAPEEPALPSFRRRTFESHNLEPIVGKARLTHFGYFT
jgi:hypothetical protein